MKENQSILELTNQDLESSPQSKFEMLIKGCGMEKMTKDEFDRAIKLQFEKYPDNSASKVAEIKGDILKSI